MPGARIPPLPRKRTRSIPVSTGAGRRSDKNIEPFAVAVPPPPTIHETEDKALSDEQQVARVELMMLKGIKSVRILMTTLGIDSKPRMERLIQKVHARWEITGGGKDIKRHRGEALSRLDLVESELWVKFQNTDSAKDATPLMKLILEVQSQRNDIIGLTPKVIERLALMPEQTSEIANRLAKQAGLSLMAGRLAEIIAERRAQLREQQGLIIEHQPQLQKSETFDDVPFEDVEAGRRVR